MHITRLSLHRSRPSTRCSNQPYIQSSTAAASKTEKASSEPLRGRAPTTIEYRNGLERTRRRRAQGHRPPPDARTRTRAFNAPVAFPPNTLVTGNVVGNRHPCRHSFCSLPHQMTPSRHQKSKLWVARCCMASDPRLDMFPSWGRVGRRLTALPPL